jgi:hypothetical protein
MKWKSTKTCSAQKSIYAYERAISAGVVKHFQFSKVRLLILKTPRKVNHLRLLSVTRIVCWFYVTCVLEIRVTTLWWRVGGGKIRNTVLSVSLYVNVGKTEFLRQNSCECRCSNREIGLLKASTTSNVRILWRVRVASLINNGFRIRWIDLLDS